MAEPECEKTILGQEKKPFSFVLLKKKDAKVLEKKEVKETDFVHALEGKEVKSTKPKEKEKLLVIPLIKRNDYGRHGNRQSDKSEKSDDKPTSDQIGKPKVQDGEQPKSEIGEKPKENNLEDDAVKEIIKDAALYNDDWEGRGKEDLNLTIPILMQNQVPEGFETDGKLDVSIRPNEATNADYSQVPIEQFGLAMLRGMGWNQGEGIGGKMKKFVKPIEAVLRPKGQGLGADRRPGDELDRKKIRKLKPGDKRVEEEPQGFAKGVGVLVTGGAHKNLYGKIEGVDEDNARLVIKLALSGQSATLSQSSVKIVDKDEYRKFSRDLSRFSKAHEASKEKTATQRDRDQDHSAKSTSHHGDKEKRTHSDDKHRTDDHDRDSGNHRDKHSHTHRGSKRDTDSDRHGETREKKHDKYKDRHDERTNEDRRDDRSEKRRKLEDTYGRVSPHGESHNGHSDHTEQRHWLRPDLRVRFIDKQYKKGRYYNTKVNIVDVATRDTCTCRTDDGKLLDGIDQSMVETLIPKTEMACVMIVAGGLKGQLGSLVKRDKTRAKADVQLLRDRDQIKRLDYDDICEYAGNIHDEDDY
ncbi:G-patch domain and KOW motifs-containing protein-like [Asterias rubens]|uniref:G-patch domain and KOW motifs-containing protein-like n=1 Tax=Asterias rubens TaxID=7604 RepID=UPI001455D8CA|nr:G-patch domain and KOW motifs-containing protein-like [Asterias rubens]